MTSEDGGVRSGGPQKKRRSGRGPERLGFKGVLGGGIGFDYTPLKKLKESTAASGLPVNSTGPSLPAVRWVAAGTAQGRLGLVRARLRRLLR